MRATLLRRLFVAGLVTAMSLLAGASAHAGKSDTVVLNGEETCVRVLATRDPDAGPQADDVLGFGDRFGYVDGRGLLMFRGAGTAQRLRSDAGRWYAVADDGRETLVGLRVACTDRPAKERILIEAAAAFPDAALARLRGITLDHWTDAAAALLERIDLATCHVSLSLEIEGAVPDLPDRIHALRLRLGAARTDITPLSRLTRTRRLFVASGTDGVTDWSPLSTMTRLEFLEAAILPDSAATVPRLPALRAYHAYFERYVTDVSFVARFPKLRELDLYGTRVTDLRPIAALDELRTVDAQLTGVTHLPDSELPKLRSIDILGHRLSVDAAREFCRSHPNCAVKHSYLEEFRAAASGADGLRLLSGALDGDALLFETRDRAVVSSFLSLIRFDDRASYGVCKCLGGAHVELRRKGEIALDVVLFHGQAFRCAAFSGSGMLTPESADRVCTWFTEHGAREESPGQLAARKTAAAALRDAAQDALLGAERGRAARDCASRREFAELIRSAAPDVSARIDLLIGLAALDQGDEKTSGHALAGRALASLRTQYLTGVVTRLGRFLTADEIPAAARFAAADAVFELEDEFDSLGIEVRQTLRLAAARRIAERGQSGDTLSAGRVLRLQQTPETLAFVLSLLPAIGEDGVAVSAPTDEQMELAYTFAREAPEPDAPRLRALVAASRRPGEWSEMIEREITRTRRK